tara:strand:- start:3686 stop:4375 length:690 start_codon:yes stop_codon:yes gene_type:complete
MSSISTSKAIFDVSRFCSQISSDFEGTTTVGSKVTDVDTFIKILTGAMASHDPSKDEVEGQHYVQLPLSGELLNSVSCGVGERFGRTAADYIPRDHRGVVGAYLKREFALPVSKVAVIVYTLEAYAADPDVSDEEVQRVTDFLVAKGDPYVIVAVLASYGSESPLSPRRFVANFAGNNVMQQRRDSIEAGIADLSDSIASSVASDALRLIFEEAAEVTEYDEKYCVVAD